MTALWTPGGEKLVPLTTSPYTVHVELLNGGQYPISGAVLHIDTDDALLEVVFGTILPGRSAEESYEDRSQQLAD